MIHVYGTSHVSKESLELIDEKIEEHDPEVVAIELDLARLNALLSGDQDSSGPLFMRVLKKLQDRIGLKTGMMPGSEMLHAYRRSVAENRDVVLIDQDIRITIRRLKEVPRKEKFLAFASLIYGFIRGGGFDIESIPEEKLMQQILLEFKRRFPHLYRVLVIERNRVMAETLNQVQEDNPDSDIVAFVGAAHVEDLENQLENTDY